MAHVGQKAAFCPLTRFGLAIGPHQLLVELLHQLVLQERDIHLPPDEQGQHEQQGKLQGRDQAGSDDLLADPLAAGDVEQGRLLVDLQGQLVELGKQGGQLLIKLLMGRLIQRLVLDRPEPEIGQGDEAAHLLAGLLINLGMLQQVAILALQHQLNPADQNVVSELELDLRLIFQGILKAQRLVVELEIVPHDVVFTLTGAVLQLLELPVLDGTDTGKRQQQHAEHDEQGALTGCHGLHDAVHSTLILLICQMARP